MPETPFKILVIDDHVMMHRTLEKVLNSQGFQFIGAFDAVSALSKAVSEAPDLILLDLRLPDMDGKQVVRSLKTDPKTRGIPIVFITATLSKKNDKEEKYVDVDGKQYLAFAKPLYYPKLVSVIRKEVNAFRKNNQTGPSPWLLKGAGRQAMLFSDYGRKVAEAFQEYLKTGDETLIEEFSAKELKAAISRLSPYYDHNKQWYRELERRIEELNVLEQVERRRARTDLQQFKKSWLDKIIFLALGFLIALLLKWLKL